MARAVLLTGITGFVGSHLAERLVVGGDEVHGLAVEAPPFPNLAAVHDQVRIHPGDLLDVEAVRRALDAARPSCVIHLAGQAVPTLAAADPLAAIRVNVMGTATVLAALADHPGVRLVFASSAEVYGNPERVPVAEDAPLRPANVYAASKLAAEALLGEVGRRGANPITILRPANQNGPRQHPGLAASAFAKQIAEIEAGRAEPVIWHGDLSAKRDFVDVRDMAAAFALASELDEPGVGVYNAGSGDPVALSTVLELLVRKARVPLRTEVDPARVRVGHASVLSLDASRFRARTGWMPRIPLERTLDDLLRWWRAEVARPDPVPAR